MKKANTHKFPHLLNDKGMKLLSYAIVKQALKDLTQPDRSIALEAYDWIFTERSRLVFDASCYDEEIIRCHIRILMRHNKLPALAQSSAEKKAA